MLDTATESDPYGTAQTYNASLNYYVNDHSYVNAYMDYYSQHLKTDMGEAVLKDFPVKMGTMTLKGQAKIDGGGTKEYKQKNYGISWNGKTDKKRLANPGVHEQIQLGHDKESEGASGHSGSLL